MKVSGLNDELDQLIEGLPDGLFEPPDAPMLAPYGGLSRDPYGALIGVRDRFGPIVPRTNDGLLGNLPFPNVEMQDETHPIFVVLGWEAHMEIMRQPDVFHNGDGAYGAHEQAVGRIVTLTDGQDHDSHRKLLLEAFGRPAVGRLHDELVNPISEWLVDRVVHRLKDGKPCCFARDLGIPMAYKVMTSLLGLPQEKFAYFIDLGAKLFNPASDFDAAIRAAGELYDLFADELADRRAHPKDDLISWLATAQIGGQALTDDDVILHSRFFLPAGIETTARSIALLGVAVLSDPARYDEVCGHPDLVDSAVEEANRWLPSGFIVPRRVVQDTVVAGVELPALSSILSIQGIVNRDPAQWPDPDAFDLHRELRPNLTFNAGPHLCMGMHLAKLEMRTILGAVAQRLPGLRLACAPEDIIIEGLQIRTPRLVPLAA